MTQQPPNRHPPLQHSALYLLAALLGFGCAALMIWGGGTGFITGVVGLLVLTLITGISTLVWESRHRRTSGVLGVHATFVMVAVLAGFAGVLLRQSTDTPPVLAKQQATPQPKSHPRAKPPVRPQPKASTPTTATPAPKPAPESSSATPAPKPELIRLAAAELLESIKHAKSAAEAELDSLTEADVASLRESIETMKSNFSSVKPLLTETEAAEIAEAIREWEKAIASSPAAKASKPAAVTHGDYPLTS